MQDLTSTDIEKLRGELLDLRKRMLDSRKQIADEVENLRVLGQRTGIVQKLLEPYVSNEELQAGDINRAIR